MAKTIRTQNPLLAKTVPVSRVMVEVLNVEIGIINSGEQAGKLDYVNILASNLPEELNTCGMGLDLKGYKGKVFTSRTIGNLVIAESTYTDAAKEKAQSTKDVDKEKK